MSYTLINARPSPYGRKIAIALREKGLDYTVEYDRPWSEGTATSHYSPIEQLPILVTERDGPVYDSPYILEWLEVRHPEPRLVPADDDGRLETKKRQMLGERLLDFAGVLMFEANREHKSQPWIDRHERKVLGALAELDKIYTAGKPNDLLVDLGDIAVVTTLDLLEFVVADAIVPDIAVMRWRGQYPALTALVDRLDQRPSFKATMPEHMEFRMADTVS
ncbi:MAG: glutathione S-transferase N-terminal domain-containing protein [Pseudomonadota bacterium]